MQEFALPSLRGATYVKNRRDKAWSWPSLSSGRGERGGWSFDRPLSAYERGGALAARPIHGVSLEGGLLKVRLRFHDLPADVEQVEVDLRLDDASDADAPATTLTRRRFGPLPVDADTGTLTLELPQVEAPGAALNVRAVALRVDGEPVRFINTSQIAWPAPLHRGAAGGAASDTLDADVFRIS